MASAKSVDTYSGQGDVTLWSVSYESFAKYFTKILTALVLAIVVSLGVGAVLASGFGAVHIVEVATALVAAASLSMLIPVYRARTATPISVELNQNGVRIVKGLSKKQERFVPYTEIARIIVKRPRKLSIFSQPMFVEVELHTVRGGVEYFYIDEERLEQFVTLLKKLGIMVTPA
jgi:hypothetical protein